MPGRRPLGEREAQEALRQGPDCSRHGSGGGAERHDAGGVAGTAAGGPQASQPEELQRGGGEDDGQLQGAHETPPMSAHASKNSEVNAKSGYV